MDTQAAAVLALAVALPRSNTTNSNPHASPALPPKLSAINAKLESCRIKPGSTDRTHWIEVTVKQGAQFDITQGEVICKVTFGTQFAEGLTTIGIPSDPQIAGFSAQAQTLSGYELISSGIPNGSTISIRPIVIPSAGPL